MKKIVVHFSRREDGGLRAWCDDVPGFVLSHRDAQAVMDDVEPALETILSSMHGKPVAVAIRTSRSQTHHPRSSTALDVIW